MSLPSIRKHLSELGVTDPALATPEQRHEAFIRSFHSDLPLGTAYLIHQVQECREHGRRVRRDVDPNLRLGKEIARICGGSRLRPHFEQEFEVNIGFYNCCSPVLVPSGGDLEMSDVEQIELQNGDQRSPNC